jgi:hypothetical protein
MQIVVLALLLPCGLAGDSRFWRQIQGYQRQALGYNQRPIVYVCA